MPISTDQFEELDDGEPSPETNAAKILSFLAANSDKAFTRSEIAEATEVKEGSVGPTLTRLRERGRVDHRGRYWRISDHDQSLDQSLDHAAATASRHETDQFEYEDWQAHAVDPREERD